MSVGMETTVAVFETSDQEETLNQAVTTIERHAQAMVIDSDQSYQDAAAFGRLLKQKSADVKAFWKPMKDAAHKAHAEICAKEKAMLKPLEGAEKVLKQTMSAYVAEQERKRIEAEKAARRAAQAEIERRLQEAIELENQGDQSAAAAVVEEAEITEETASMVSVASQKPKATGVSSRTDWVITSVDEAKVPTTVDGVVIRPVDTAAILKIIRAAKGQVKIEGITFEEKVTMSFRR